MAEEPDNLVFPMLRAIRAKQEQHRPASSRSRTPRTTVLVAAALLAATSIVAAHGDGSVGEPGDPTKPARAVEIVMSEDKDGMHFAPDHIVAHPGEQVRFEIRNAGQVGHEFVLGAPEANKAHAAMMAEMPGMKHHDPNAVTVAPGASATLLWRFTHKGDFEFACLAPGHYEAGMHGAVAVR